MHKPDTVFSSDFIVGYPGESDKDFEDKTRPPLNRLASAV